jgi:NAD(P)-dependent dehydrogenase (short-subunit alcohol dehydrogenase family)
MALKLLSQKWNPPKEIDVSFADKTIIITGASSGLGYEAALKFAQKGVSKLILAVRDAKKGQDAKQSIEAAVGQASSDNIEVWELEMGDYESIKSFAKRVEGLERIDVVILNAGIFTKEFRRDKYGWEPTLQINVLSTTLLALLLLPKLRSSRTADYTPVLEIVSSGLYAKASAPDENPLEAWNTPDGYDSQKQYNASKLLVHCAMKQLAKIVQPTPESVPEVIVLGVCPGACVSGLARELLTSVVMRVLAGIFFALFFRSTEEGSRAFVSGVVQGPQSNGGFWKEDILQP